jgi:ABC-type amino acid transport substrate-binding protein
VYPRSWGAFASSGTEQLTGFLSDLLYAAGEESHFTLRIVVDDAQALPILLETGQADAILTTLPVNTITTRLYDFSSPVFVGGTVLVVAASSRFTTVDTVGNAEIGFLRSDSLDLAVGAKTSWLLKPYDSQALAIDDVIMGRIDGILLNFMDAIYLNKSLYRSKLRILLPPVVKKSVKIATLKGKNPELIAMINERIMNLVRKGEYAELLKYWGIEHSLPTEEQKKLLGKTT